MTFEQILQDLNNKIFHPVYLLHGEEPYFIDKVSEKVEDTVLNEAERSFNQTVVYGKEADPLALLDVVRRYPMMANYQVVILKEAQQMRGLDKLMNYFEQPLKSTVFVICHKYKTLNKNTKLYKLLKKNAVVLESKKVYDNQVPAFINAIVKGKGFSMKPQTAQLLTEYLGTDISKIEMELEKLMLNVEAGSEINMQHIERYIGISKDYNIFEFINAIATRNTEKAFKISQYFVANPKLNPPVKVIGGIYSFFGKAYTYQFIKNQPDKEVMSALRTWPAAMKDMRSFTSNYSADQAAEVVQILGEYDLRSKGVENVSSDKSPLLTEMVYRMLSV